MVVEKVAGGGEMDVCELSLSHCLWTHGGGKGRQAIVPGLMVMER